MATSKFYNLQRRCIVKGLDWIKVKSKSFLLEMFDFCLFCLILILLCVCDLPIAVTSLLTKSSYDKLVLCSVQVELLARRLDYFQASSQTIIGHSS